MENEQLNNQDSSSPTILSHIKQHFRSIDYGQCVRNRIPPIQWLPQYTISKLLHDMLAGFTVSLTEVPQGIAFAVIAGLSPEYGLYSGFMGGFMYFLFGTCKDINIGPTSIMALMLQKHVQKMGPDAAVIITFLAGVIIFALGMMNLAFVVEFFSYPIIAGFTCAASLQIASTQIKPLFGISGKADKFLDAWVQFFGHLDEIKKWDTLLGICSIVLLVLLRELRRFGSLYPNAEYPLWRNCFRIFMFLLSLARNALIVIIGTVIAYKLRDNEPFAITKNVKGGLPPFELPPFTIRNTSANGTVTTFDFADILTDYGPSLAFLPLVAILEAISIAKAFSKGKTLDATQEMLSLGVCNVMGSFVRSMPITGSFTRTAVNNASGVQTTLGGVFTSICILLVIQFLTPAFYYVPKATLASVIICAMFYLFDFDAFVVLYKARKLDLVPFLTTFLCCIFISLEYGILIGIAVNLCFVLYASARPKLIHEEKQVNSINAAIFTPQTTLHFPAAQFLKETVLNYAQTHGECDLVVVSGKYVKSMDVTLAKNVSALMQEMKLINKQILLVDFKASVQSVCIGNDEKTRSLFWDKSLEDFTIDRQELDNVAIN